MERFSPIYIPGSYPQDGKKSIVTQDGRYDFRRFSRTESSTIRKVINTAKEKYPIDFLSVGIANESSGILYKERSVLFEMIIVLYEHSDRPIDRFAVSLAYETKGARFRKESITYFEKACEEITPDFMSQFLSFSPLSVYSKLSKLYEAEHIYAKAIELASLAQKYGDVDNPFFEERILFLKSKQEKPPKTRTRKVPQSEIELDESIKQAAYKFISELNL